jgi:flagellar basal-body rod protein FlgF
MNNTLYVGLSRQMTLQREMDVIANNIANSDTAGFKVESTRVQTDTETPRVGPGGGQPTAINFAYDAGVDRDFGQGATRATGAPFDLALQGDGFFSVQGKDGVTRYTRDGRFSLDGAGQIVDISGDPVQGDSGGAIVVDPLKSAPQIARDGTITQTDPLSGAVSVVGKIGVVNFANRGALQKIGNGQYENVSNLASQPAKGVSVLQGSLENSNVNPIVQMTRMIAVSRAYEQIANMMGQTGDTSDQSIQRLGRVPS